MSGTGDDPQKPLKGAQLDAMRRPTHGIERRHPLPRSKREKRLRRCFEFLVSWLWTGLERSDAPTYLTQARLSLRNARYGCWAASATKRRMPLSCSGSKGIFSHPCRSGRHPHEWCKQLRIETAGEPLDFSKSLFVLA
jgi:hypothetical protein